MTTEDHTLDDLLRELTSAEGGWWTLRTAKGAMDVVLTDALDREHYDAVGDALTPAHDRIQSAKRAIRKYVDGLRAERDKLAEKLKVKTTYVTNVVTTGIPRVITAEELRECQWVAIPDGSPWVAGKVTLINDGWVNLEVGRRGDVYDFKLEYLSEVVLLADTPTDQQEPERRGEVVQPEGLRCGDIADVWAGDKIIFDASEVKTVTADNVWFCDQGYGGIPCTTRAGHEFRRISRPTPAPVTAETIRASEAGSTYTDKDGNVWEWDGYSMRSHGYKATGSPTSVDAVVNICKPLTRSTAAPRGDYGKAEVPTEAGKTALDYADEWRELYKKDPEAASKFLADAVGRLMLPAKVVTDE